MLLALGREHRALGRRPARGRDQRRRQHGQHPAARGDRAGAGDDRRRGRRPGRLHERAHRRVRRRAMSTTTSWSCSASCSALVVVAVLAVALIRVRQGLTQHLRGPRHARRRARGRRGRAPAPARARRQGDQRAVRHHPRRAAGHRPQGRDRGREEAAMTLWWIGNAVLLLVVLPVVVYLLNGVLRPPRSIVPSVEQIADVTGRRVQGPRRRPAAADDAGPGPADGRGRRQLRRLARRDHRRRREEA